MAELRKFEFFVLRYVPNAVRGEFVNFGLLMFEPEGTFLDLRFARNWDRVMESDGQADIEMLEAIKRDLPIQVVNAPDRVAYIRKMQDSFLGVIQLSERETFLSALPQVEIEGLASMYLEVPKFTKTRELSERERILGGIQSAFDLAGVGSLVMKRIPIAMYTRPGDPFHIDFGYEANRAITMFHAVPLRANVDQALLLAARYTVIAAGIRKIRDLAPRLTAVVDDGIDRGPEEIGFAIASLQEQQIQVAALSEMPRLAEIARQELRA